MRTGEAVLDGQRLAVHADREQRVAVVGERLERSAAVNPSTEVESTMSASAAGGLRLREQLADRIPEPHGVADEVAADFVRHAGQRGGGGLHEGGSASSSSQVSVTSWPTRPWIRSRHCVGSTWGGTTSAVSMR